MILLGFNQLASVPFVREEMQGQTFKIHFRKENPRNGRKQTYSREIPS